MLLLRRVARRCAVPAVRAGLLQTPAELIALAVDVGGEEPAAVAPKERPENLAVGLRDG